MVNGSSISSVFVWAKFTFVYDWFFRNCVVGFLLLMFSGDLIFRGYLIFIIVVVGALMLSITGFCSSIYHIYYYLYFYPFKMIRAVYFKFKFEHINKKKILG
jgi:hypothetical protein